MVKNVHWFLHPIAVFIFSTLALASSLFLYIYWYIEVSSGLKALVRRFNLDADQVLASQTWVVVLVLSLLVALILCGIFIIFLFSQKLLRSYRLQNNFINNFTHELKTPVASLKLFLETFQKHDLCRADQQRYFGYMLADVERLADNVNRILNLARLESKSYRGEFQSEDLVEVISQCLKRHQPVFDECRIRLIAPGDQRYRYPLDRPMFEMLVMNLLVNAVKYNESEQPCIEIDFQRLARHLAVRFQDNGIGLPAGDVKKLFKRFYQSGRSNSRAPRGSGLGLSLVQQIARIHQAKVTAQNRKDGGGSVFQVMLPLKKLQIIQAQAPTAEPGSG